MVSGKEPFARARLLIFIVRSQGEYLFEAFCKEYLPMVTNSFLFHVFQQRSFSWYENFQPAGNCPFLFSIKTLPIGENRFRKSAEHVFD